MQNAELAKIGTEGNDAMPIVDWYTNSYPFICVTMFSDCTGMVWGETALRKGDSSILEVRGPRMVSLGPKVIGSRKFHHWRSHRTGEVFGAYEQGDGRRRQSSEELH